MQGRRLLRIPGFGTRCSALSGPSWQMVPVNAGNVRGPSAGLSAFQGWMWNWVS